nr:S41 family peptidase [Pseudopedobacter sp.]
MSESKNHYLKYAIIAIIASLFGVIVGAIYQQNLSDANGGSFPSFSLHSNDKLDKILRVVKNNYVDSVNTDSLEELAISDILNSLDPHSVYLPPSDAKHQNESLEGNFDGIGIEYYILNDSLFVTHVRESGPSFKAGILKGDKIIAVNGQGLKGDKLLANNIVSKLRGKRGSSVKVSIVRKGIAQPKQFEIVRDRIVVSSIDVSYLMQGSSVGFIKIGKFGANTDEDFSDALNQLQKNGMKSLILDLRGNGGGYLSAATALADQFLSEGKLIVYTKGLHEPRTDYKATKEGSFENGKLMILIDEGTASASEIVTGALQDLDRATIIGRRSFGKGLVQEQFGFGDGSAMNLTIARYYTPSGRSIQKSYNDGFDTYRDEINHRFEHGDYVSLDSALRDSTFSENHKIYKTTKGRTVYGGGGIMPDIFIPLDTSKITPFFESVQHSSVIPQFVYGFLINKPEVQKFKNANDFLNGFKISDADFQRFLAYCKQKKIAINISDAKISKSLIVVQLEALLARYYFDEEGFYRIFNKDDDFIKKALDKIKSPA